MIIPHEHFLPVSHDHSNVEEIVESLRDSQKIQKMVDSAWSHVASNRELKFEYLIAKFDKDVNWIVAKKPRRTGVRPNNQIFEQSLLVGQFATTRAESSRIA